MLSSSRMLSITLFLSSYYFKTQSTLTQRRLDRLYREILFNEAATIHLWLLSIWSLVIPDRNKLLVLKKKKTTHKKHCL